MGPSGLEPPTSRLSGVRSNRLSYEPIWFYTVFRSPFTLGGDERDRTDDPLLAKQVLSQLSYTPILPGSVISLEFLLKFFRTPKIKQRLFRIPSDLGC